MKFTVIYALTLSFLLIGCIDSYQYGSDEEVGEVNGYRPVYISKEEAQMILAEDPRPIENAGKFYVYGELLLINEVNKGIHLIDNSNPSDPVNLKFIQIPGSQEIVIKGDMIYSNNFNDLVALRISSTELELVKRIPEVVQAMSITPPQMSYFECYDPKKGIVVEWEYVTLNNPKCRM